MFKRNSIVLLSGIVVALLAISACSGLPADSTTDQPAEPPAPAASPDGAGLPNAPQSESEWDQHELNLAGLAESYGVKDPEPVSVVRWVTPEEAGEYADQCVEDRGFERTESGMFVNIPDAQSEIFMLALYECSAAYPVIPRYTLRLTDENLENVYEWLVDDNIPCIESMGYEVDNVPSKATYVSTYRTEPYYPLEQLASLPSSELASIDETCGQWPAASVVYGE